MTTTRTAPGPATTRAGGDPHSSCGTFGGYERHRYRKEEPCDACRKANNAEKRDQGHARARGRATLALARLPELADEYAALVAEQGGHPRRCDRARRELARRHPDKLQPLLTDEIARLAIEGDT